MEFAMERVVNQNFYYFSLQYSAIQKTVLRHDRLWSIAGISNILSRMNEIDMPAIARKHGGEPIVAGGGKFTARFPVEDCAEEARAACAQLVATTLPMLEFQISRVYPGATFESIQNDLKRNKLITELSDQKRSFRGYAVSFNPHLLLCSECGEYPAQKKHWRDSDKYVCRVCQCANEESSRLSRNRDVSEKTTLQKVYSAYLDVFDVAPEDVKPAADFEDLFPGKQTERKRMAAWFSDLNNMNDKVPVWLRQSDESQVLETFSRFRQTVINIIVEALAQTFGKPTRKVLPFRLVVAGGDDLCLVMAEKDILAFALNLSRALNRVKGTLPDDHPLSDAWLMKNGDFTGKEIKPFSFGASFVITSIHTPFSQIHRVGEDLMSAAKKATDRQGNSVDWRIMAEERAVTEQLLNFERPLFIEADDRGENSLQRLTFSDYLELRSAYGGKLSGSHMQQIVSIMQGEKNPWELDRKLKLLDAAEADKSFSFLLRDSRFRDGNNMLLPQRIATLFELMTIAGGDQ